MSGSLRMNGRNEFWSSGETSLKQVQTSRGFLEYADVGRGLPILYFHGTGAGSDAAVTMERALIDDGFRLIVPNRPGYYGTPLSSGRSTNECADLAAALLDELQIGRVVVVGTSGGGMTAPTFAARHPGKSAALLLQCAVTHCFDSSRWMPPHLRRLFLLFRHPRVFLPIEQRGEALCPYCGTRYVLKGGPRQGH